MKSNSRKKPSKDACKPQSKKIKTQDMPTHKGFFARTFAKLSDSFKQLSEKPALFIFVAAFALSVVMEAFARRSVLKSVLFIFTNPVAFMLGVAIISATLLPTLFFKRRYAAMGLIMTLWLAMAVTDFVVRCFRITPFSAMDISLITSVFSIVNVYLSVWGIILVVLLIAMGLLAIIVMFLKLPHTRFNLKTRAMAACKLAIFFGLAFFTALQSGAIDGKFANLGTAYDTYGFTYCFSASIFSRGISKPSGYSQEAVEDIDQRLSSIKKPSPAKVTNPNIIFVQLESYFDVNYLSGVKYSQDPVATFTELKQKYPHGSLTVPSIGAGTANTEFEILTGMNKEYFGIGEYPYKTILQDHSCESICYNLKASGYTSHAIHNHYGTFYDRNKVFANLGFDTFTPVEYMTYVPTTPWGWEKDSILPSYIDSALRSTPEQDFVFAITVQGHGKYPTMPIDGYTPEITITDGVEDEAYRYSLEYYVNMIHETDMMIKTLTEKYADYDEPVMIVLYGDHLPNINLTAEQLTTGELLNTEYVIWTNYDLEAEQLETDLTAYQLSSYVMQLCDKSDGVLTKIHQSYRNDENTGDYQHMLYIMEYDMLYGNDYMGNKKYEPTDIKLGINDITIKNAGTRYDEESGQSTTVIQGNGFTAWSVVYINGYETRTVFKDSSTLIIENASITEGDVITVSQVTQNRVVLSTTDEYIVPKTAGGSDGE